MNIQERKYFIIGISSTICLSSFVYLTIIFSQEIVRYSGIATFYSLLLVIILFILKESIERKKEISKDKNILKNLLIDTNLILGNVEHYNQRFIIEGGLPAHSLNYFDTSLPAEIDNKSTQKLNELIFFANDKINTLDERREELLKISVDPNTSDNKRIRALQKYFSAIRPTIIDAITELHSCLENIKKELKRWNIF